MEQLRNSAASCACGVYPLCLLVAAITVKYKSAHSAVSVRASKTQVSTLDVISMV